MHIGFLTPEYVTDKTVDGGLANYLKKTATYLVDRGNKVTIFVISDIDKEWYDENIHIIEIAQIPINHVILGMPIICYFYYLINKFQNFQKIARSVIKYHSRFPFDIVQISSYMTPGYALVHNKKFPIVCRASSYSPLVRKAYGRHSNYQDRILDWIEIQQIKKSDAVFAPSLFLSKILCQKSGKDIQVIRTAIDSPHFLQFDESIYQNLLLGKKYILFFGTLSRIKGVDLIADIISKIVNIHPEIFFVFIGRDDGMQGHRKIFDYVKIKSYPYQERVIYHTALPKAQLYPIISHSIAVIIPSRVDNYPNVCLEAQYFGIPVIGTTMSSLEEMVNDGETGFLAENENVDSLLQAVHKLLKLSTEEQNAMKRNIYVHLKSILKEDRIGELLFFYQKTIDMYNNTKLG